MLSTVSGRRGIILPTFEQQRNPDLIPEKIKSRLKDVGLWDINPLNLFRITWKNEPVDKGGLYGGVNFIELPAQPHRGGCAHHPSHRQMVPHRRT